MSEQDREAIGSALLSAAILLALAIFGSAFLLSQALDRSSLQLRKIGAQINPPDSRRGGARVDPEKRYSVPIAGAPSLGNSGAPVTIVEWADFQCPFCGRVNPTLEEVRKVYGERVRLVFKHLPLEMHPQAEVAHAAAEAAHRQGKFWPMHDRIFAAPRELSPEKFSVYARQIGLDLDQFERDLKSSSVSARIRQDVADAQELGVTGTPSFFINGRFLSGAQPFESFKRAIEEELRKQPSG